MSSWQSTTASTRQSVSQLVRSKLDHNFSNTRCMCQLHTCDAVMLENKRPAWRNAVVKNGDTFFSSSLLQTRNTNVNCSSLGWHVDFQTTLGVSPALEQASHQCSQHNAPSYAVKQSPQVLYWPDGFQQIIHWARQRALQDQGWSQQRRAECRPSELCYLGLHAVDVTPCSWSCITALISYAMHVTPGLMTLL